MKTQFPAVYRSIYRSGHVAGEKAARDRMAEIAQVKVIPAHIAIEGFLSGKTAKDIMVNLLSPSPLPADIPQPIAGGG
ncbi:MAG TPA: hypothetical protein PKB02_10675 [Anaerohalosphaeraceae bacterium]|nr:hypothetical protein [Anaerohalosphaeraceae bacterium]